MSESSNTQIVQDAYAAFLRGDIHTILNMVADDVEWQAVKGTEGIAPHAGLRRGRAAVAEFFEQVIRVTDFATFEPREFVAQGDAVMAIGYYSGSVKPTQRPFACEWVMAFTICNGRIARFREWTDSAQLVEAFGGKPAAARAAAAHV
jgi:ketosteroid isomerase-like protein